MNLDPIAANRAVQGTPANTATAVGGSAANVRGAGNAAGAGSAANATGGAANPASAAAGVGTDSAAGTEDRFLKLLVAQMRNQDPLNPLDNAQVTSQLAQINTVRGIEQLNASMATLASASTAVSPVSA
ncbi:MAG: flagellar hook assembly protein FlgD, partial [Gammaproteobacteria bacterium]